MVEECIQLSGLGGVQGVCILGHVHGNAALQHRYRNAIQHLQLIIQGVNKGGALLILGRYRAVFAYGD